MHAVFGAALVLVAVSAPLGVKNARASTGQSPSIIEDHRSFEIESGGVVSMDKVGVSDGNADATCLNTGGRVDVGAPQGAPTTDDRLAGIVDSTDGTMTLGELATAGFAATGYTAYNSAPVFARLWIDTGGDRKFFSFSSGKRTGLANDSYGSLNASWTGSSLTFDSGTAYTGLAGSAPSGSIAGLRSALGDATRVAVWMGIVRPSGTSGTIDGVIQSFGLSGRTHPVCSGPVALVFPTSIARGDAFEVGVRGPLSYDAYHRPFWDPLPLQTDSVRIKFRKPNGSILDLSGSVTNGWGTVQVPSSETQTNVGQWIAGAFAVNAASDYATGSTQKAFSVIDIPTSISAILFAPSTTPMLPGGRMDMQVSVGRAGGLPAQAIAVHWTVIDPLRQVQLDRIVLTTAVGLSATFVGGVSTNSSTAASQPMQTAVPGSYEVTATIEGTSLTTSEFFTVP